MVKVLIHQGVLKHTRTERTQLSLSSASHQVDHLGYRAEYGAYTQVVMREYCVSFPRPKQDLPLLTRPSWLIQ